MSAFTGMWMTRTLYPAVRAEQKTAPSAGHAGRAAVKRRLLRAAVHPLHADSTLTPLRRPRALAGVEVRRLQHVVNGFGVHPKRAPNPDCRQFAVVDKPVDGHFADPHQRRHLGHREKLSSGRLAIGRSGVSPRFIAS
jgi:hypothetical protein